MTQERRHLRKDVPQMLKQQIPNHQLHKISHKTNPSLNSSHKMNPSLNSLKMSPSLNSHKMFLPVNNNHKAKHPLVLYRNLFHLNSAMTMKHFQMHGPWPEKLLPQKIPDLYQRNQDIVYNQKQITFNPFCLIFSLQIKRKMSYTLENSRIVTKCQVHQNSLIYHLPVMYSLKCISSLFSTNQTFN